MECTRFTRPFFPLSLSVSDHHLSSASSPPSTPFCPVFCRLVQPVAPSNYRRKSAALDDRFRNLNISRRAPSRPSPKQTGLVPKPQPVWLHTYMYSSSHHRPTHVSRPSAHRARSSSDPFSDPVYPAPHVAYTSAHTRDRDRERERDRDRAPPLPPKQPQKQQYAVHAKSKLARQYTDRNPRMETAVRDTVKIEPRSKVSRSQTGYVSLPLAFLNLPTNSSGI